MFSDRSWLVVGLLAIGCTRQSDSEHRTGASVRMKDAARSLNDAGVPDAGPRDEEAERYMHLLGGEDGVGIDGAIEWLVEHPARARPLVRADLLRSNAGGIDVKFELQILGRIGDPADVPLLRSWLLKGNEIHTYYAADALRTHPSPGAFDALVDGLASKQLEVVTRSSRALGRRGDERARAPLEARLDDPSSSVRFAVVSALGDLGVEASRARLERRLSDETDRDVVDALDKVLGNP